MAGNFNAKSKRNMILGLIISFNLSLTSHKQLVLVTAPVSTGASINLSTEHE
jgi:hypothetical protein